jgi:O-antigen/teichoic acid export membrane protein
MLAQPGPQDSASRENYLKQTDYVRQKITLSYASQMVTQLIGAVTGLIVARIVGPRVLGQMALGLSYVGMFAFLSDMGVNTAHVKLVSEKRDWALCNGVFVRLKIALTALLALGTAGAFIVQNYWLRPGSFDREATWIIGLCLAAAVIDSVAMIPKSNFIARTERAKHDLIFMGNQVLTRLSRMVLALFGFGAIALTVPNAVGGALTLPILFHFAKDHPFGKWDSSLFRAYAKIAFPLLVMTAIGSFAGNFDRLLLQALAGVEQLGYYSIVFGLSIFLQIVGLAVTNVYFPMFSRLLTEGRSLEIAGHVRDYQTFLHIFVGPSLLFMVVGSSTILPIILGPSYLMSCSILSLVLIGVYLNVLSQPLGNILSAGGRFWRVAAIQAVYLAIFAALEYVMVAPRFLAMGGLGAACAFLAANLFLNSVYRHQAAKFLGSRVDESPIFLFLLAWGGLNSLAYIHWWVMRPRYAYPAFFPFYLVLTYGIMALLGLVTRKHWGLLLSSSQLSEMVRYIRSEFGGGGGNRE